MSAKNLQELLDSKESITGAYLTGREAIDIPGLAGKLSPRMAVTATIHYPDKPNAELPLHLMILTADEVAYFENGGILQYVLRNLIAA